MSSPRPLIYSLVAETGIAEEMAAQGPRGVLSGGYLPREQLFVAGHVKLSTFAEGEQPFRASRLLGHHAFRPERGSVDYLPFILVKPGFAQRLRKSGMQKHEFKGWTADGMDYEVDDSHPVACTCCVEFADGISTLSLVIFLSNRERIYSGSVHLVGNDPQLPPKYSGLAPLEALKTKKVALVGCGSVGSIAAVALAAAGIGIIHLFDPDELAPENLHRHVCGIGDLGRKKVVALQDHISEHNLPVRVFPHDVSVTTDPADLWRVIPDVDLVLGATDNTESRALLNYVCVRARKTLLLSCAFENARLGEVIRVRPGLSACYECTRAALRLSGTLSDPDQTNAAPTHSYRIDDLAANGPQETGTRVDVSTIGNLQAKAAIVTLLHTTDGSGQPIEPDLPTDYLAWGNASNSDYPFPFNFDAPFSANWTRIARQPDCPICSYVGPVEDRRRESTYVRTLAAIRRSKGLSQDI